MAVSRRELGRLLVAGVIVTSPLLIGSAPRWAACLVVAAAALAAIPFVWSRRALPARPVLLWFLGVAAGVTAFQLIPLPPWLVELLSPARYELAADNAAAMGFGAPGWMSLTVDPPATLVELSKLLGCAVFAYAALCAASSPRGRLVVAVAVAGAGAGVAVLTVVHNLLGSDSVYGLYEARYARRPVLVSPFLNPNHLAGFMAVTAPMAAALAAGARGSLRLVWAVSVALMFVVALLSESRTGAVSTVVGLVAVSWLLYARHRHGDRPTPRTHHTSLLPIAIVVVCAVVLLGALAAGGLITQYQQTSVDELSGESGKTAAWAGSGRLVRAYPLMGVGRGALEEAFTSVRPIGGPLHSHVENEYLQAVVDWGVPTAVVLAGLGLWMLLIAAKRYRNGPLETAALAGVLALLAHSVFDFALSLPAVAFAATALAALLTAAELRKASRPQLRRGVRLAAVIATLAVTGAAASPLGESSGQAVAGLQRDPASVTLDQAVAVWRAHPASYGAAATTARTLFRQGDRRAVAVANRALRLRPADSSTHRLVGRMLLASRNRDQALVEYGQAIEHATSGLEALIAETVTQFPDPSEVARVLPTEPVRSRRVRFVLRKQHHDELLLRYLELAFERGEADHEVALELAEIARGLGRGELELAAARESYRLRSSPRAAFVYAEALLTAGQPKEAYDVADRAMRRTVPGDRERVELTLVTARANVDLGRPDVAVVTLDGLLAERVAPRLEIKVLNYLATLEQQRGNGAQAAQYRRRAAVLRQSLGSSR